MPKGILQEKSQRTMPQTEREPKDWATFESQRRTHATAEQRIASARPGATGADLTAPRTNMMPPGMNVENQAISPRTSTPYSNAGATDESNSVNAAMLSRGYQRQNMRPEDEMYNNEHVEEFYGEATVDGETGFVERNNYLDRN